MFYWTVRKPALTSLRKRRKSWLRAALSATAFNFPRCGVGLSEIYWQRPLAAWWDEQNNEVKTIENSPLGYLTAYGIVDFNIVHPVELWPRLQRREAYLTALHNFEHLDEHYTHQTTLNILRVLDASKIWPQKISVRRFYPADAAFARARNTGTVAGCITGEGEKY